jgi:anaerobic selenocysteine-containing dehydrogenase
MENFKTQVSNDIIRTVCGDCHAGCGIRVHVKNGKAVKIEGDPYHPWNQGMMCAKGLAYLQTIYHPNRITHPIKRMGERGEGKWQKISWDEALDTIASKYKKIQEKYGPYSIAGITGGKPLKTLRTTFSFIYSMGSPNATFSDSHFCWGPYVIAERYLLGGIVSQEKCCDLQNTNLMLLWSGDPNRGCPPFARKIALARARGAKLIVINPRFTELPSKADIWLQIRPGTDGALALGMLNIIINEGLYDKQFVEKWCIGFDELCKRVQQYPPEKVAKITWLNKDDIIKVARLYATTKPASLYRRSGIEQIVNAVQTCRAIAMLIALTGNLETKGGNFFPVASPIPGVIGHHQPMEKQFWPPDDGMIKNKIGAEEFPLLCGEKSPFGVAHSPSLFRTMVTDKPYPIKGLFTNNNPLIAIPNSRDVLAALKRVEFTVVAEFFMTPTAEFADIILPAATPLEVDDIITYYTNLLVWSPKVIKPIGECRDELDIFIDILKRMGKKYLGYITDEPIENSEDELKYRLRKSSITLDELKERYIISSPIEYKKYERNGFNTPSGKVELYSGTFEEFGYDPLPNYVEPESPTKEYPFILITNGVTLGYMHSMGRQIPWLRELEPAPLLEIHPETARELGIEDGDWVWVELPRAEGRIRQKAIITKGIHPKVIHCKPHWWYPERSGPDYGQAEVNINNLIKAWPPGDAICGNTVLAGLTCRIYKDGD